MQLLNLRSYQGTVQVPWVQGATAELERLLIGREKVAGACSVGIYDARQATENPRAFVVTTESGVPREVLAKNDLVGHEGSEA